MIDVNFIMRLLEITGGAGMCDELNWRTDGEFAPVTFWVNCSDLFFWACADAEAVTPENVEVLAQAIADARAACPKFGDTYAGMLFCSRVRKMRPQGAAYPRHRELWPLFDACGPEREKDTKRPEAA